MDNNDTYYHTAESAEEYIKLAKGVNGQAHIDKLKPLLQSDARVLEFGSGPGSDWEILNRDFEVTGSDFSKAFLTRLQAKFPNGDFIELDAQKVDVSPIYNAIYSNKVLHHLTDEALKESVFNQHKALIPAGIICHTFWRGAGAENFKGMFVNYHEKSGLEAFFSPFFDIITLKPYAEFEANDSLILIAKKKK